MSDPMDEDKDKKEVKVLDKKDIEILKTYVSTLLSKSKSHRLGDRTV
jgi:hypothetical protein